MRYVAARLEHKHRETAYRIYITDALKVLSMNTAKFAGGEYLTERYADQLKEKPKDTRTGEEIVADVLRRGGIEVI